MRSLYSLLLYLLMPLVLLYLLFRGLRSRDYLYRWSQRFGFFTPPRQKGALWIHAVSMGEVNAATALIRALAEKHPDKPMCITTFTPTGSARVQELFGDEVFHVYLPFDLPGSVSRFYDRVQPVLGVIMETEIWPNLLHGASSRNIPCVIANARISDHSIDHYRRFRRLTTPALGKVSRLAAQSERDAKRLVAIGAPQDRVSVSGNLKFDFKLPVGLQDEGRAIRQAWGEQRAVLVAGSTHEIDESSLIDAFKYVLTHVSDALLVLVPRHPERFDSCAQAARSAGLKVSRFSENRDCQADTQCFVVDAMGELLRYYAACDVAFVGGSFVPIGGHNPLEPAALARPLVVGPHMFNSAEITAQLIESGAARQVNDAAALGETLLELFEKPDLRRKMGQAGYRQVQNGQGAVNRTLELIESLITEEAG